MQKNKVESAVSHASETSLRKSDISLPISSATTNEQVTIAAAPVITTDAPVIKRKQKEPRPEEIDVMNQLKDICFLMNPNEIYKDMIKIGQGFVLHKFFGFIEFTLFALELQVVCLLRIVHLSMKEVVNPLSQ